MHYTEFGIALLDDSNAVRVRAMEWKHMRDAKQINMEILQEWVKGSGKQPVTWDTLIDALYDIDIELTELALEIAAVKGSAE